MREINVSSVTEAVRDMCIEANHILSPDMKAVFSRAISTEQSSLGRQVLGQLEENLVIAGKDMIPICQDTGMTVVFIELGQGYIS